MLINRGIASIYLWTENAPMQGQKRHSIFWMSLKRPRKHKGDGHDCGRRPLNKCIESEHL